MKMNSWYLTVGISGLFAASAVACTTSVNGGVGDDASAEDSGAQPDTGIVPANDGSTVVPEGGDAGITCEIPAGSDACDTCSLTSCCDAENACQSEPANDGGTTDCEDIFSCVQVCLAPPADSGVDGGTFTDCTSLCSAGHTTQGTTDFGALSSCLATHCATQCE